MCGGSNNVLEDIVSGVSQVATGGLVDLGPGGAKKGGLLTFAEDVVKDISGANAAEDANKIARDQFEESQRQAKQAQEDARNRTARDQLQASRLAGSNRKSGASKSGSNKSKGGGGFNTNTTKLGSDEQDFLGL